MSERPAVPDGSPAPGADQPPAQSLYPHGGKWGPESAQGDPYQLLVEHSLGLMCTHALDGTLLLVNRAAADSLGYSPALGVGRNLREFLAADVRPEFESYLQRIRERGHDTGLFRLTSRGGDERIWMYRNVRVDDPPRESYVLGHALDVTEQIAARRALRKSEQALLHAYEELEARVRERTAELQLANERLRAEIQERQLAEQTRERVLMRERDTLAFLGEVSRQLTPVIDVGGVLAALHRLPVPFLADWTLVFVVNDDGRVGCAGGTHATPEHEGALAAFGAALSGTPPRECALARAIASGGRELITGESASIAARLSGPGVTVFTPAGLRAVLLLPVSMGARVVAVAVLGSLTDLRFIPADLAIADDLAARVHSALERVDLYHEAQEANRLKDEFLTTLSHELRTPMNAILGWARLLRMGAQVGVDKALAVIERNAQVQARLIDEILDLSRIMRGKLQLDTAPLQLEVVVHAAVDAIRPTARAKPVHVEERVEDALPTVTGDAHRLQQVVSNLLSNAVKFTGPGGTITVTLTAAGDCIELAVTDTGIGIRREVLPFIFDRFRQADSSSSRVHGGLGLGLAIVRQIVELHGGTVSAQSIGPGRGATFTVHLPITPRLQPPEPVPPPSQLWEPLLTGRRVLVVEDDPDARHFVAVVLRASGANVNTAADAWEAMDQLAHAVPEVIVADIGLPGEDGYALLRRIRQLAPERGGTVPAIALTAFARAEDREHALAAGFNQHIVKPVDPLALARAVAALLG